MPPDPMPWRAIDAAAVSAPAGPGAPVDGPERPRLLMTVIVLAAAVAVAVIAVVAMLPTSGSASTVVVDGGAPLAIAGSSARSTAGEPSSSGSARTGEVVVEIVGAIARPGVYHLPRGARVADLVTMAGGFAARVDVAGVSRAINQAAVLVDGTQIRVPSRDDPAPVGAGGGGSTGSGGAIGSPATGHPTGPVDLNRATSAELDALPGIGPVTAAKIIAARETTPFASVDDLLARKLVGQKTFDGLRDLVTVDR